MCNSVMYGDSRAEDSLLHGVGLQLLWSRAAHCRQASGSQRPQRPFEHAKVEMTF